MISIIVERNSHGHPAHRIKKNGIYSFENIKMRLGM
jgi:hypothetical protein